MTVIEAVITNFDCETPVIGPEIRAWEFQISRGSIRSIQHLHEGVSILA